MANNLILIPLVATIIVGASSQLIDIAHDSSKRTVEFSSDMNSMIDCAFGGVYIEECNPDYLEESASLIVDLNRFEQDLQEIRQQLEVGELYALQLSDDINWGIEVSQSQEDRVTLRVVDFKNKRESIKTLTGEDFGRLDLNYDSIDDVELSIVDQQLRLTPVSPSIIASSTPAFIVLALILFVLLIIDVAISRGIQSGIKKKRNSTVYKECKITLHKHTVVIRCGSQTCTFARQEKYNVFELMLLTWQARDLPINALYLFKLLQHSL